MLYLDNAATSWPKPETVYQEVEKALRMGGNPGRGVNTTSLSASRILFEARRELADFFNAPKPERIIFTQNATEGINLILKGYLSSGDHVLISSVEHNAVVRPLETLKEQGIDYSLIPCDETGLIDIALMKKLIKQNTKLIVLTHASNVLGTIQPVQEMGAIANKHGIYFMVDASQTAGILPIDVQNMKIDFLAFTGHKGLMGPQGTGGVYIREGLQVKSLIQGGTGHHSASLTQPVVLPEGLESGTRNLPGIAGLLAGVRYCRTHRAEMRAHELKLIDRLISYLKQKPKVSYYGPRKAEDRVGLIAFNIEGFSADTVGTLLDRTYGIISRTGLHCSPLAHRVAKTIETGSLRISVGPFTTEDDIESLIQALDSIIGG